MRRGWWLAFAAAFLLLAGALAFVVTRQRPSELTVEVTELPVGVAGDVLVTGPDGFRHHITRTTTFSDVPAGRYALSASPVVQGSNSFYPPARVMSFSVPPHESTRVEAAYADLVPSTTRVLDAGALRLAPGTDATGNTLVFTGPASPTVATLAAGDVIVAGIGPDTPHGLIRKVVAVRREHGNVVVVTAPATLRDAIPRGAFHIHATIEAGARSPVRVLTVGARSAQRAPIRLARYVLPSLADANGGIGSQISLGQNPQCGSEADVDASVGLSLTPSIDFQVDWGVLSPNYVRFVGSLSDEAELSLAVSVAGFCQKDASIGPFELGEIEFSVGPVPVVITPSWKLVGELTGEIQQSSGFDLKQDAQVKAGVQWDGDHGVQPITDFENNFDLSGPPASSASLSLGGGPELAFDLYGQDGEGPYLQGQAELKTEVADSDLDVVAGLRFQAGVKLSFLGFNLDENVHLEPIETTLATIPLGSESPSPPNTTTGPPSGTPAAGGEIVFSCAPNGGSICEMNPDGSDVRTVVRCGDPAKEAGCTRPALSPDGSKLAYDGGEGSFVIRDQRDGSTVAPEWEVPGCCNAPAWSPEGGRLALIDASGSIRIIGADGTQQSLLVPQPGANPIGNLAWSPDGNEIAYVAASGALDAVAVSGGRARSILPGASAAPDAANVIALTWAPGADLLVEAAGPTGSSIEEVNPDGTGLRPVLPPAGETAPSYSDPSWGPDGVHFSAIRDGRVVIATVDQGVRGPPLTQGGVVDAQWGG